MTLGVRFINRSVSQAWALKKNGFNSKLSREDKPVPEQVCMDTSSEVVGNADCEFHSEIIYKVGDYVHKSDVKKCI